MSSSKTKKLRDSFWARTRVQLNVALLHLQCAPYFSISRHRGQLINDKYTKGYFRVMASAKSCAADANADNNRARVLLILFILSAIILNVTGINLDRPFLTRRPQGTSEAHPGGVGPRGSPGVGPPPPWPPQGPHRPRTSGDPQRKWQDRREEQQQQHDGHYYYSGPGQFGAYVSDRARL